MDIINSFDEILYTAIVFIPGLIFHLFRSFLWPENEKEWQKDILSYFTFGGLNLIIWGWLILKIYKENWFENYPSYFFIISALIIFISPIVFSFLSVILYRPLNAVRGWICKVFIGKSKILDYDSSWKYIFHNLADEHYLIVTMTDGKKVHGKYTINSYESIKKDSKDLYIEECYKVSEEGDWVSKNSGIYIDGSYIRTIEFYEGEDDE